MSRSFRQANPFLAYTGEEVRTDNIVSYNQTFSSDFKTDRANDQACIAIYVICNGCIGREVIFKWVVWMEELQL